MVWAAIVKGIADLTGNAYGAEQQKKINEQTINFNREEAQKNREWEEMMSNTALQRRKKDAIAAGLNPVLALTEGSHAGAATPAGTAAQVSGLKAPRMDFGGIAGGMITALAQKAGIDKMQAEIDALKAETERTRAQTKTEENLPERIKAETDAIKLSLEETKEKINNIIANTDLQTANTAKAKAERMKIAEEIAHEIEKTLKTAQETRNLFTENAIKKREAEIIGNEAKISEKTVYAKIAKEYISVAKDLFIVSTGIGLVGKYRNAINNIQKAGFELLKKTNQIKK